MPEYLLKSSASIRPTTRDQFNAAVIARHIHENGHKPTPSLILKLALAYTAQSLLPPPIPVEILNRAFAPIAARFAAPIGTTEAKEALKGHPCR